MGLISRIIWFPLADPENTGAGSEAGGDMVGSIPRSSEGEEVDSISQLGDSLQYTGLYLRPRRLFAIICQ